MSYIIFWKIKSMKPSDSNFTIVAEIGVNHEGSLDKALELIYLASDAGADAVKFQSYTPERFIASNDPERRERTRRFFLSREAHLKLAKLANQLGTAFMSTPITEDWVDFLNPLCSVFKIASGDLTFKPLIDAVLKTEKQIYLSTGASTIEEIDRTVSWIQKSIGGQALKDRLTLLHCVSAYPTPIEEANIFSIPFLRERYQLNVGYSNHVMGMSACLSAVVLGASVVEVHFTDQKNNREFRDHALSFDANDLKTFVQLSKEIRQSLGKYEKKIQPCESGGVKLIRKGIVAAKNLKVGDVLKREDLMYARPATEFHALELENIIGKKINRDIHSGYTITRDAILCAE